jgi:hypothetical protein
VLRPLYLSHSAIAVAKVSFSISFCESQEPRAKCRVSHGGGLPCLLNFAGRREAPLGCAPPKSISLIYGSLLVFNENVNRHFQSHFRASCYS